MKMHIKDREVELRYTMRALIMYENIMDKPFAPKTTMDIVVFMLCVLLASDKQLQLTLDELLDIIDEDTNIFVEFANWLTDEVTKQNMATQDTHIEVEQGKKKK